MRTNGNGARAARVDELPPRAGAAPRLDEAYAGGAAVAVSAPPDDEPADAFGEPLSDADVDDNLRRYAWWQARDFVRNRAVWLVPLALLAVWIFRDNYDAAEVARRFASGARSYPGGGEPEVFRNLVLGLCGAGGVLGSLIATFGIVSRERERGLQRFLFAKPVRITSYYLQAFVLNGLGLLAVVALTLLLTAVVFVRPVPFGEGMLLATAGYLAIGGFSFLLSTLFRFDFAAAGILSVLSLPVFGAGERWQYPLATVGRWLLPPIPALVQIVEPGVRVVPGGTAGALALCAAYGLACVAGGVMVLRRRSITT